MGLISEIFIFLFIGIIIGSVIGYVIKTQMITLSDMTNVPVEINSDMPVIDVIDNYGITSRPPSYQSNEEERPLSPESAEDPPPYRSNENLDVEMIEMRPIPPSK